MDGQPAQGGKKWERVILVTGGAGFIASHVVLRLVKKYPQYKIVNFDRLDYCACLKNLQEIKDAPNYKFVKGDIRSQDLVLYLFRTEEIDTVMHFAAQTHVDNSFGNSLEFTSSNVIGTHTLLETARTVGNLKLFLHVSTDEVYGEGAEEAMHCENTILNPTNPYAASKAGAEYLVRSYQRSFNLPVIITRGNNVFGPHQYPEKVVPKFILQLLHGLKLTLHGSGTNRRNYLFVEDAARAFDTIVHKGTIGLIYNIGSNTELDNYSVARDILCLVKGIDTNNKEKAEELLKDHVRWVGDRPFNDMRYPLDNSRLEELGWKEKVTWEEGLKRTYDWYKENYANWSSWREALVAHPRRGLLQQEVRDGLPESNTEDDQ